MLQVTLDTDIAPVKRWDALIRIFGCDHDHGKQNLLIKILIYSIDFLIWPGSHLNQVEYVYFTDRFIFKSFDGMETCEI